MIKLNICLAVLLVAFSIQGLLGQESVKEQSEYLEKGRATITKNEKELLKVEVSDINTRLDNEEITIEEANVLKQEVAKKRALNIQNKIIILENQMAFDVRNNSDSLTLDEKYSWDFTAHESYSWLKKNFRNGVLLEADKPSKIKYDRRTYSAPVIADGFNYVSTNGSLKDFNSSSFESAIFFELGWQWRTRVFKESNFLRFNYGLSLQVNPIQMRYNERYVLDNDKALLQEFEFPLESAVFKRINLVMPFYLELGPSKVSRTENSIRYSIKNQLRFGIGAYAGVNWDTKQKLRYYENGVRTKLKQKNNFNTNKEIYGLSAYAGIGGFLIYAKYDLNPIFQDTDVKYRNFSIGLRTDL